MKNIVTLMLITGEEIVGEFVSADDYQIIMKKPVVVHHTQIIGTHASRLDRYMTLDSGEVDTVFYLQHILASAKCSQKTVDYYTKIVDKCYNDSLQEIANTSKEDGITPEEIITLISGRRTIQ